MKDAAKIPTTQTGVKYDKRVNKVKTEGAFQEKVDKLNNILKSAPLPNEAGR